MKVFFNVSTFFIEQNQQIVHVEKVVYNIDNR